VGILEAGTGVMTRGSDRRWTTHALTLPIHIVENDISTTFSHVIDWHRITKGRVFGQPELQSHVVAPVAAGAKTVEVNECF